MKKLLMLSAKKMEIPFILQAQMLGYYVITTGNAPNQPGHKYADEYIKFDYSDYDGITRMAEDKGISAVMRGCSDNCALTAAYICEKLGLKGHDSFEVTKIIHRKNEFKKFANKYDIKTPIGTCFSSLSEALDQSIGFSLPVIVKPNDLAGGQGVSIVRQHSEFKAAIEKAFLSSNSKNIVIEPYIEGTLHSLHVFLVDKKVRAFGTANDYSYLNKFMTSYGVFPADNWNIAVRALIPEIERIAEILDLVDGQIDTQYIMRNEEPFIIEMMRRSPGNHTTAVISNSIGLNWREWIVRAEAGESIKGMPHSNFPQKYYGYYCAMPSHNGAYNKIFIDDDFANNVLQVEEWEQAGHIVKNYLYEKMGIVLFYFDSKEEAKDKLSRINSLIQVI